VLPPPDQEVAEWRWWMAPAGFGLGLLVTFTFFFLLSAVLAGAGLDVTGKDKDVLSVLGTLVQELSFVGAALFVAGRTTGGRLRPRDFALQRVRLRDGVIWAAAAVVAYIVFVTVWNQIAGAQKQDDIFKELGVHRQSALGVALVAVIVCVIAPAAEEFFFRGFAFGALLPRFGVLGSAAAVGLVFGAVHGASTPLVLLPELVVLGVVLCLLRWRTGSLLPCIAVHAINNSIAYGYLLHWGWQIPLLAAGSLALLALLLSPVVEARPVAVGS
jgi:membrane protease YdiL (CAAX protease family)